MRKLGYRMIMKGFEYGRDHYLVLLRVGLEKNGNGKKSESTEGNRIGLY